MVETAVRLYREATPKALRFAPEIWDAMTKAQDRLIKSIRSRNFEKFISVAHKFISTRCVSYLCVFILFFIFL